MAKGQDLVDIASNAASIAVKAASGLDAYSETITMEAIKAKDRYEAFLRSNTTRMYPPSPPERKPERDRDEELPFYA